jgi:hypothetical protein
MKKSKPKLDTGDFSGGFKTESFMGIPFEEDPNCPPGQMLMMNDKYMEFVRIDNCTKWQRFKDKVVKLWHRLTKNS